MAFASLTIDLNARLANIERDLGRMSHIAEKQAQRMQSAFAGVGKTLGALGVGASVAGLGAMVKTSIDAADAISKLSVKTGIAVENLAGWQHVADLSGLATEQFEMAVGKLNTVIVKTPEKLRAVGVTATDAHGALLQLSDVFARVEDPTRRAALAAELFGERVGRDMTVALSQGRGAIEDLIRQGQELNPVTAELAKNAEQFNDALRTLSKRADAAAVSLAGPLVKSVNQIIERFLAGEKAGRGFAESLFNAVFSGGNKLSDRARKLNKDLEEALSVLSQREANAAANRSRLGPLGQQVIDARLQSARQRVADLRAELKQINAEANALLKQAPSTTGPKIGNDAVDRVFGARKSDSAAKAAFKRGIEAQNTEFERAMDLEDYRIEQQTKAMLEARANALAETDQAFAMDEDRAAQAEREAATLGRLRDGYIDLIDPVQRYREQLDEVQKLGELGLLNADQVTEATFAIQEQIDAINTVGDKLQDTKDFAKEFGLTFNSALEDALVNGKKFSDVLKSLEQDIARIIIRKSVTEPLGNAASQIFSSIFKGIGSIFGGGKASGGPVYPGKYYVVGENGPEVLVPNAAGTVIPNTKLGGGGVTIVQNISVDSRSDRSSIMSAMSAAKDAAKAEILQSMQRGGTFARAAGRA